VDLQERYQLDMDKVKAVRAKARPWRSIFALLIAIAGAVAAEVSQVPGWGHLSGQPKTQVVIYVCGSIAFFVFGMAAAVGLSSRARTTSQTIIGQAHAGVLRYVLVLVGVFTVLTGTLAIGRIEVRQLLVGGAVTGVILGIAAQQSLGNLFAGLVLLFAHPFRVGDHVRFRAGALGGQLEGIVIDISLTYVRLETDDGPVLLPNSQALAAPVILVPAAPPAEIVSQSPDISTP
jgi:small-conductance mechanosensitive channel